MAERNSKGQFVKGQSGNPTGRSRSTPVFHDEEGNPLPIEEILTRNGHLVVQQHVELIMDKKTASSAKMTAITEFYKRWLGAHPDNAVKPSSSDDDFDVSGMDAADLLKLVHSNERKK